MNEFDTLVAVVTGGASGIGAAVARRLADGGATGAVLDLNPDGADPQFFAVATDVSDDDQWHRVWDVNVVGMTRITRATLPYLRESPATSVVNLSSIVATAGLPQRVLYTSTKGAVLSMTRAMAADHLREGIRFNAVNPGTADTPWVNSLLAKADDPVAERKVLKLRQPHGQLVSPDEVAGAVAYLASPLSGSTAVTSIAIDRGMQELRLRPQ